jgi:hypothetical protein
VLGAYLALAAVPFDSFALAWDRTQILWLAAYFLLPAVPFFFGGAVVGTLLARGPGAGVPSHLVYAASLAGSAAGALLALWITARTGGPGGIALAAAAAAAAAACFGLAASRPTPTRSAALGAIALAVAALFPPSLLEVSPSPYKALSQVLRIPGTTLVSTRYDDTARVDHLSGSSIRTLPGLSFTHTGPVPRQDGLTFDGDDLSPIPLEAPTEAEFASHLLVSLPFSLRPGGRVAVLEPRGGLDVLVALAGGAGAVTAVEPSSATAAVLRETAGDPYEDPRVVLAAEEPRAWAERTRDHYDVIDLALTAPYRPVASGAYSLAEDYSLTVEAWRALGDRLAPGGMIVAVRWLQNPPSETIRLVSLAAAAARDHDSDPRQAVLVLRSYSAGLVMFKPDGFTAAEVAAARDFAADHRFDLVAAPGLSPADANRFNLLPVDDYHTLATALLRGTGAGAASRFDISAPTDDRPFFDHYFTWHQAGEVLQGLGHSWQPFGGAGYFVLLALLAVAAGAAALLIVAPLAIRTRRPAAENLGGSRTRWWTLGYFGALGIGFLFVEIPLIQRYILLVGHPATALAVVLFALLVASGAGSALSPRLPWRPAAWGVAVVAAAYPWVLTLLSGPVLSLPVWLRIAVGAVLITPLGFLMGTLFPRGVAHLERHAAHLIPWAWAVNGSLSVISAVAAALLALGYGFSRVVWMGAACYAAAGILARPTPRTG